MLPPRLSNRTTPLLFHQTEPVVDSLGAEAQLLPPALTSECRRLPRDPPLTGQCSKLVESDAAREYGGIPGY